MKNDELAFEIQCLHDAILHYLRSNPNAADSLEGIMNWWLPKRGYAQANTEKVMPILRIFIYMIYIMKLNDERITIGFYCTHRTTLNYT